MFHPSLDVVESFYVIARDECKDLNRGIFYDWDTIMYRYHKDQLIVLYRDNDPIGLATWYREDKVVEIEDIWIVPKYRKNGSGFKFQELLNREFKKRRDVAITLFCASEEGLSLARRHGFIPTNIACDFSNNHIKLGRQASYIKILKNENFEVDNSEELTISCFERYISGDSYYGDLKLNGNFEKTPVYKYVNLDWECQVILNVKWQNNLCVKIGMYFAEA